MIENAITQVDLIAEQVPMTVVVVEPQVSTLTVDPDLLLVSGDTVVEVVEVA